MEEKHVFILWLQGWENAPWLSKQVAESWEMNNPDWKINYIDLENLKDYVNDIDYIYDTNKSITPQAKSDIIRLSLLKNHGGIWADATMLCMQPLEHWVHEAVEKSGMWMYRGGGYKGRIAKSWGWASWFIVAKKNNEIINKWKECCDDYWSKNNKALEYFWMDRLLHGIFIHNIDIKQKWLCTPALCCEEEGQSHTLAKHNNGVESNTPHIKKKLLEKPPYALKLWKHYSTFLSNESEKSINSNGYYAIEMSKRKYVYKHIMK